MTWTRTRTLSVLLFVSLAFNLFLGGAIASRWAWHHWHGPDRAMAGGDAGAWLKHVIDEDTAPQVETLWLKHKAAIKPLRAEARRLHRRLHAALAADPFDPAVYADALRKRRDQRTNMQALHHVFMLEVAKVLTPEQRQKLVEHAGRGRWRWRPRSE